MVARSDDDALLHMHSQMNQGDPAPYHASPPTVRYKNAVLPRSQALPLRNAIMYTRGEPGVFSHVSMTYSK